MPIRVRCGQCDEDVTEFVRRECKRNDDLAPMFKVKPSKVKDLTDHNVEVTCSNGHLCRYSCALFD